MSNCNGCGSSTPQPCCQDCQDQNPCGQGCLDIIDAGCIEYNGDDLESVGVEATDKLDTILLAIDQALADIQPGNYEDFEYGCLASLNIDSRQDFVESMASMICQIIGTQVPGAITPISTLSTSLQTLTTTVGGINTQATLDDFETISGLPGPTATTSALFLALQQLVVSHDQDILDLQALGSTSITPVDSPSVDLTVSGAGNHTIQADVNLSAVANNAITEQVDGLHVISPSISASNTSTVNITANGTANHTISAAVNVSATVDNQITIEPDGLYVAAASLSETPIVATDSTSIGFSTSGTSDHEITAEVIIDPSVNNILIDTGSGLFVDGSSVTIGNNSVGDAQLRDSNPYSIIGRSAGTNGDPGDIVAGSDGVLRRSGSGALGFGTLVTGNIGNDQVTFAKIQNVSSNTLLGRSTSGSGDLESLSAGSHISISAGSINTVGRTLIGITKFNSDGTWTKPAGCNAVLVYTIGAGGGGGGALSNALEAAVGAPGGAGGGQVHFLTSGLGATETVTVGVAGTGGTAGTFYVGSDGGPSSFGAHTSVDGGDGGQSVTTSTTPQIQPGGAGGTSFLAPTGLIYSGQGAQGSPSIIISGTVAQHGTSPGSILGGGSSNAPGAGGEGVTAFNGAISDGIDGINGIVIVYEYS